MIGSEERQSRRRWMTIKSNRFTLKWFECARNCFFLLCKYHSARSRIQRSGAQKRHCIRKARDVPLCLLLNSLLLVPLCVAFVSQHADTYTHMCRLSTKITFEQNRCTFERFTLLLLLWFCAFTNAIAILDTSFVEGKKTARELLKIDNFVCFCRGLNS